MLFLSGNEENSLLKEQLLNYEPSCSQKQTCVTLPQKSSESSSNLDSPLPPGSQISSQMYVGGSGGMNVSTNMGLMSRSRSPLDAIENQSDNTSNLETEQKIRVSQVYSQSNSDTITQAIGPMIVPKCEQDDSDMMESRDLRYEREEHIMQQHHLQQQQQHHQQQQHEQHHQQQLHQQQLVQHFAGNYAGHHSILASQSNSPLNSQGSPLGPAAPSQASVPGVANIQHNLTSSSHQSQYSPVMMNRFRSMFSDFKYIFFYFKFEFRFAGRGERMSKDQKELYVKFFEENPCMLTQRRNDVLLEPLWNKLANLLNSVPQGAVKNVEEWKQVFKMIVANIGEL